MNVLSTLASSAPEPRVAAGRPVPIFAFPAPRLAGGSGAALALVPTGYRFGEWPDASAAAERVAELRDWWANLLSEMHAFIYQGGTAAVTGVQIPVEAQSPQAARDYLADLLVQLGDLYQWGGTARQLAAQMRALPPAGTVVDTVERVQALGPPRDWAGAEQWYDLGDQLQRAARYVNFGEMHGLWVQYGVDFMGQLQALGQTLDKHAQRFGTGFSIGAGATLAAAAVGVLGYVFWPEIRAGIGMVQARRKYGSK